eukprot:1178563-Prorocentrum_minimum.AAC.5
MSATTAGGIMCLFVSPVSLQAGAFPLVSLPFSVSLPLSVILPLSVCRFDILGHFDIGLLRFPLHRRQQMSPERPRLSVAAVLPVPTVGSA